MGVSYYKYSNLRLAIILNLLNLGVEMDVDVGDWMLEVGCWKTPNSELRTLNSEP